MNITADFFQRDPVTCAREMIGCELVWNGCGGLIVETEAYSVRNDEACHTFTRPSSREFVTRMPAGCGVCVFELRCALAAELSNQGRERGWLCFDSSLGADTGNRGNDPPP